MAEWGAVEVVGEAKVSEGGWVDPPHPRANARRVSYTE